MHRKTADALNTRVLTREEAVGRFRETPPAPRQAQSATDKQPEKKKD